MSRTPQVGQQIRYFSQKVFGVPVSARITKIGKKYLHIQANFHGLTWTTKILPEQILPEYP